MIILDINNPNPKSVDIYSHELNKLHEVAVGFEDNGKLIHTLDEGIIVTANIATASGIFIAENVETMWSNDPNNAPAVVINISSTENYSVPAGDVLIEFKLHQEKTGKIIVAASRLKVRFIPSVLNNTIVTGESFGKLIDILREIDAIWGDYDSLSDRLNNIESGKNVSGKWNYTNLNEQAGNKYPLPLDEADISDYDSSRTMLFSILLSADSLYDGSTATDAILYQPTSTRRFIISTADGLFMQQKVNGVWQKPFKQEVVIEGSSIDSSKLAADSVTEAKIEMKYRNEIRSTINAVDVLDTAVANLKMSVENKLDDADNSVKSNNIQNSSIGLEKLDRNLVTTSDNSAQALAFANDTTIPTTKLVKGWIEGQIENVSDLLDGKIDNATNVISYTHLDYDLRNLLSELQSQGSGESTSGLAVYIESIAKSYSGMYLPITLDDLNYIQEEKFNLYYDSSAYSNYGAYNTEFSKLDITDSTKYKLCVTRTGGTRDIMIRFQKASNFNASDMIKEFSIKGTDSTLETVFELTSDELSQIKYMYIYTTTNDGDTSATANVTIHSMTPREWSRRKIYAATLDASALNTDNAYRILLFNIPNTGGRNLGVYHQIAIGQDGVVWYRDRDQSDMAEWGDFKTTCTKVNVSEDNFEGCYELSTNTMTIAGRIGITSDVNTARFKTSAYIPIWSASVIGRGSSGKYYIVDVSTNAPTVAFTVKNMDGTTPTGEDTVRFAVTTLKS